MYWKHTTFRFFVFFDGYTYLEESAGVSCEEYDHSASAFI